MRLVHWSPSLRPSRGIVGLGDDLDRLVDGLFQSPVSAEGQARFSPAVDIEETSEGYVLRADLPGLSQDEVKVSITGDTLTLRGERKREERRKDGRIHRVERVHGAFERSFTFEIPVRSDGVAASYKDGVLEIRVPKADVARQREVEIKVGS